jgi:hypothetical protein
MHSLDERVDDSRIRQRRRVTKLVLLSAQDLAENSPHDLATSCLGQVVDNVDALGGGERSDRLAHLDDQVLAQLGGVLESVLDGHEGVDRLTGQLV